MSDFCGFIVFLFILAIPILIILFAFFLVKKKRIKLIKNLIFSDFILIFFFTLIGTFLNQQETEKTKIILEGNQVLKNIGEIAESEADKIEKRKNIIINDTVEEDSEFYYKQVKYGLTEKEFKEKCTEIIYNNISEKTVGEYVYKDLFNWKTENNNFKCCAKEDFIEDIKGYQKTYRIYKVIDCRKDKTFPIENDDIIRVYGVVDSVSESYFTGGYNPTIKVYYIEYIRKYGEEKENKTMAQITEERNAKNEQIQKENEYKESLNSDYTGITKNIEGMKELPLKEYISYCDKMNYKDLYCGEDLIGRHVSIKAKLFSHKIFKNNGKEKRLGIYTNVDDIHDDFWEIELYSERAEDYVADFGNIYFENKENISPMDMKKGNNIVLYGEIIKQPEEYYDDWEIIVRYYEIKK